MSLFEQNSLSGIYDSAKSAIGNVAGKVADATAGAFDPKNIRTAASSLAGQMQNILGKNFPGLAVPSVAPSVIVSPQGQVGGAKENDWRVKVSVPVGAQLLYRTAGQIMAPILVTDGVIFPYAPTVNVSYKSNYQPQRLTHTNYTTYSYENSEVNAITIAGDFTVQNQYEGAYLMAALHFFRSATKMFFGSGDFQGNPPPILVLSGYGKPYLPDVRCILTDFQHTMPPDVDYLPVDINTDAGPQKVRMPTTSNISITVQPVYSRANVRSNFNHNDFSSGKLLDKGFM